MERYSQFSHRHVWTWIFALAGAGILALLPSTVDADTQLMTPIQAPKEVAGTPEMYPESRFGKPAADLKTGIDSGFVATNKEPDEIDQSVPSKEGRVPASVKVQSTLGSDPTTPMLIAKRGGVQEIAVIAGDLGYFPKTFFVTRDIPVRLFVTGASKHSLCLMMDSFHVSKQVRSQKVEEIAFTPTSPGKFRFYCPINGMEGTMIVKEFASAIPVAEE